MKVGITGPNGFIGKALVLHGCLPLHCDVAQPEKVEREISEKKPDVILHLAAKSDVDFCEDRKNEKVVVNVNLRGTYNVMHHATKCGIPCVLMSTGQIWKGGFWERDHREDYSRTLPVNQYGISKLAAEALVSQAFSDIGGKIIRSSYVFDAKRLEPKLDKLRKGEELEEPVFIRRSFIYIKDFVDLLLEYCGRIDEMPAVLHLAGSETCSWYDFIYEFAKQYMMDTRLVRGRRKEIEGHAPRPHNAGLDTSLARSLGFRIPNYRDGIRRMKNEL